MDSNNNLPTQRTLGSIQTILTDSTARVERCIAYGKQLTNGLIVAEMTDEVDAQLQSYLDKTRATLKRITESRQPITRLFDDVRRQFTALENAIDPAKSGTATAQAQLLRNAYAAHKLAAQRAAQQQELARQRAEADRAAYAAAIDTAVCNYIRDSINTALEELNTLARDIEISNYKGIQGDLDRFRVALKKGWASAPIATVPVPSTLNTIEADGIAFAARSKDYSALERSYTDTITARRDQILAELPFIIEEQHRIKHIFDSTERAQREAELAARLATGEAEAAEQARLATEQQVAVNTAREQQQALTGLFNQAATQAAVTPTKAKVTLRLHILNHEAISEVFSLWWLREGQHLTTEELMKMFKKQITYCETLANKQDIRIASPNIEYVEEVRAK